MAGDSDNPLPTLIQNVDPTNIAYLGKHVGVNPNNPLECAPLNPGQTTVASGDTNIFAIASPGQTVALNVYEGVMSFFQPVSQLVIQGTNAAVLIYSPVAGQGNLVGSWAANEFTDQYGNDVPAGINATQGTLTSVLLQNPTLLGAVLNQPVINNATVNAPVITGGTIVEASVIFDSTGGQLFLYSTTTTTVTFSAAGPTTWTSPVTGTGDIRVWGGDAGAGGGSGTRGGEGGGGAEFAEEPNYPLVNGQVYNVNVGAAGQGGNTGAGGSNGGDSGFDNFGVIAGGGLAGSNFIGGLGGNKSTNTRHFKGGNGGGDGTQSTGGCGGGGRAGINGAGGNGAKSTTSAGANGGTAGSGTGGIAGANGGAAAANGNSGLAGGGGCGAATSATTGSNTYTATQSGTYYGSDATGGNANGQRSTGTPVYQGGETASGGSFNGTQKSLLTLSGNPASDLAGKTIDQVQVRLCCQHSWYNSGMYAVLGYDNRTSLPGSWDGSDISSVTYWWQASDGTAHWTDVTNYGLGTALQSGAARSLTLGPGTPGFNLYNYGYFAGAGQGGNTPAVQVNWHTGAAPVKAGNGGVGRVTVTYTSTQALTLALSPVAGADSSSNAYAAGLTVIPGTVKAFQPNVTPTAVEVWHDMRPLQNSFVGTISGQYPPQYTVTADGWVEVVGYIQTPAGTTSNYNSLTFFTIPAAYRPTSNAGHKWAITDATNFTAVGLACVQVDTSGNFQLHNLPTTGMGSHVIGIYGRYPLDSTGLITS